MMFFFFFFFFSRKYLMVGRLFWRKPLTADYALIKGWKADRAGNIVFNKTAANFNLSMAKAARFTIAEVEEIVEIGQLDPNFIHLPSIYVDRLVKPPPYQKIIEKAGCAIP